MSRLRNLPLFVAGVWLGASVAVVLAVLLLPTESTTRGPDRAPLVRSPAARRPTRLPDPLRDRAAAVPAKEMRRG